ncbi:MAG TPA: hypothetical protein VKZ18_16970 [Polyangia bacterium]|nr:hypothetical protein [Polyangia bacterium]
MFERTPSRSSRGRVIATAFAGLIVIAAAGRSEAQLVGTGGTLGTGGTTGTGGSGGSVLTTTDLFVGVEETPPVALTVFEQSRFFNRAKCDCSAPIFLTMSLLPSGVAKRTQITQQTGSVYTILGGGCTSLITTQIGNCVPVPGGTLPMLTFLNKGRLDIQTDARFLSNNLISSTLFDAGVTLNSCEGGSVQQFNQTVNFLFDYDGDGNIDFYTTLTLLIDLTPPPAPMGVTVRGGDQALVMNWDLIDTSVVPDLLGYQILCSRADQYQVFKGTNNDAGGTNGAPFGPAFQTCPTTREAAEAAGTDAIDALDPAYVCSGLLSAQATSARIEVLQNEITYAAAVVAVDNSGNASAPQILFGKPIKTLSFYDVYRNEPPAGGAAGGFCSLSTAQPRAKTTAAALGLFALGAVGVAVSRRRRRQGPKQDQDKENR